MRAAYASDPQASRGRRLPEPPSATRTAFQRDRDRILHSGAFRKLQFKTQVFVTHEGDYFRTRLTHSLEVAQIARSVSRALGLDEDLTEAIALAHDLGHAPFGHAGEDALDTAMQPYGGFRHNEQTVRVLTRLERRYPDFDGLNLSWETLEGVIKHNGPLAAATTPPAVAEIDRAWPLDLDRQPSAEAQVAALADDIAYCGHDLDDGLRAGLFEAAALDALPGTGPILDALGAAYPGLDARRLAHELVRRLLGQMIEDLLAESRSRLSGLDSAEAVRRTGRPVVGHSPAMVGAMQALRGFLFDRMYRHYRVNRETSKARRLVRDLFDLFMAEPECLPAEWQAAARSEPPPRRARVVADYIAGMTDRYATLEHRRLFGPPMGQ